MLCMMTKGRPRADPFFWNCYTVNVSIECRAHAGNNGAFHQVLKQGDRRKTSILKKLKGKIQTVFSFPL